MGNEEKVMNIMKEQEEMIKEIIPLNDIPLHRDLHRHQQLFERKIPPLLVGPLFVVRCHKHNPLPLHQVEENLITVVTLNEKALLIKVIMIVLLLLLCHQEDFMIFKVFFVKTSLNISAFIIISYPILSVFFHFRFFFFFLG